ncbi:MAG: CPBP family intramembrane glutamic endopeptidase [Planctomycetota bacterium]
MPTKPPSHGQPRRPTRRLAIAAAVELSLVPLAAGVAWWFDVPLLALVSPAGRHAEALGVGVLATLPMVAACWLLVNGTWRPIAGLRRVAQNLVNRVFAGAAAWQVVAVAIAAGVGEEVLFRGALQPLLVRWLSPWGGVITAGVIFGLVHPMSRAYVVLATIGGLYLGALAQWQGEVLSAITAHALYDVVALFWLRSGQPAEAPAMDRE